MGLPPMHDTATLATHHSHIPAAMQPHLGLCLPGKDSKYARSTWSEHHAAHLNTSLIALFCAESSCPAFLNGPCYLAGRPLQAPVLRWRSKQCHGVPSHALGAPLVAPRCAESSVLFLNWPSCLLGPAVVGSVLPVLAGARPAARMNTSRDSHSGRNVEMKPATSAHAIDRLTQLRIHTCLGQHIQRSKHR
jgi:hypothetical protein